MWKLKIKKYDETYIHVSSSDKGIERQLFDYFTFKAHNYFFMPKYRAGIWDGNIRLYNLKTKLMYAGLREAVIDFAKSNEFEIEMDYGEFAESPFSRKEADEFIASLGLPFVPYEFQKDCFIDAVQSKRRTALAATNSGKSLIIYMLAEYHRRQNNKVLIIVPNTGLIHQFESDLRSYGCKVGIHLIYSGKEKDTDDPFVISTWQSIYKMSSKWFSQFNCVIVDEVHGAKAASVKSIMEKLNHCENRFGFTGTLDGKELNELTITGLFGPIKRFASNKDLIEKKISADVYIKCLILHYNKQDKDLVKKADYDTEIAFINTHAKRREFVKNLALSLDGNVLVIVRQVKNYGKPLFELIEKSTDRKTFYVDQHVDGEERNEIRFEIDELTNSITVATERTFSTGINIRNLNYLIFASPSKASITILQSIGRMLRRTEDKTHVKIIDIADNLSHGKRKNYAIQHFLERVKIYSKEEFPFQLYNVEIK